MVPDTFRKGRRLLVSAVRRIDGTLSPRIRSADARGARDATANETRESVSVSALVIASPPSSPLRAERAELDLQVEEAQTFPV